MDGIFAPLSFFGSASGAIFIGITTAIMIVVWEWRLALLGLMIVQVGVVSASIMSGELPSEWAGVMVIVMALSTLILALSAQRMTRTSSLYQAGTWQLRTLLLGLIYVGWELADFNLPLPGITPPLADLFVWIAMCTLVTLGLSTNPLFSTVALLLWVMLAQIISAVVVESPTLVALIGTLTLLLALAGSYLILVEQVTVEEDDPVVTDIIFPSDVSIPAPPPPTVDNDTNMESWLRRQPWGEALLERARQMMARWQS